MASLNTLRTKFGIVLSIIIALALLAFILSLKTEMGFSGNDPRVGVIDGEKINYSEYYDQYEQIKSQNNVQENDEQQSAMLAKDRMRAIDPSLPFIFSADFNTNEKEETYSLLINHSYPCLDTWKAAKKREGGPATFNGWGDVENVEDNKIDFIFTSEDTKVKRAVIAPATNEKGEYVSDHNAIWADIVLK